MQGTRVFVWMKPIIPPFGEGLACLGKQASKIQPRRAQRKDKEEKEDFI
jgi:hypothetical protein